MSEKVNDSHQQVMCTRLPNKYDQIMSSVSGLAARCDWLINGKQVLNITNTQEPRTIFINGFRGGVGVNHLAMQLLHRLTTRFVLIIASEDHTFPHGKGDARPQAIMEYKRSQYQIAQILASPLVAHVFVENLDEPDHPKMSPLPLGSCDINLFIDVNDPEILNINMDSKPDKCFCAHRIRDDSTQWDDRKHVRTYSTNGGPWSKFVNYQDGEIPRSVFLKELQKAKFSICVHGGGYDPNPRFTESILAGAIPIIQHSPLDGFTNKFPVVYIDKWTSPDALTAEFLEQKLAELRPYYEYPEKRREVLKMLTLDYWWDVIMAKLAVNAKPTISNLTDREQHVREPDINAVYEKYKDTIGKFTGNEKNKVNIVVITSKIKVSATPYTYVPTRSIYTIETRFNQTINTILSVRKHIPNAFILLVDNSELPANMYKILSNMTDIFSNDYQNAVLRDYTDNTVNKFIGETAQLVHISGMITCICAKYDVIGLFKISGRYVINDNFNYKQFENDDNIFKKGTDYHYTSLYKINGRYIDDYLGHNAYILKNKDYYIKFPNKSLENILPELITDKKLVDCLGLSQYIGVFNYIDDI